LASFAAMLKLIKLIRPEISQTDSEIKLKANTSNKGNKICFEKFLDFIVHIVEKEDKDFITNRQACFNKFVENSFEPLLTEHKPSSVLNISFINYFETINKLITNYVLEDGVKQTVYNAKLGLGEIYKAYFIYENNNYHNSDKLVESSLKHFISFCEEFEILPYLLSINHIALYWQSIFTNKDFKQLISFDMKDFGKYFTFHRFCMSLVHFAYFINDFDIVDRFNTEKQKLIYLFSKLEKSNGFKNIERKTNKLHMNNIYLLDNTEVYKTRATLTNGQINMFSRKHEKSLKDLESYSNELNELFNVYTNSLEKFNFNRMGYSSFLRFLKDTDIITAKREAGMGIQETVALLIFTNLTGGKNFNKEHKKQFDKNKTFNTTFGEFKIVTANLGEGHKDTKSLVELKMNFEQFIQAMKVISYKLFPSDKAEVSIMLFIEHYIHNIEEKLIAKNSISVITSIQNRKLLREQIVKIKSKKMVYLTFNFRKPF
jgi:hypothetical protein